jgi:hypothetical protein
MGEVINMVIEPPDITTTTVHEHEYEYELKYKCRLYGCYRPRCCFRSHLDSYHLMSLSILKDEAFVDSLFSKDGLPDNK